MVEEPTNTTKREWFETYNCFPNSVVDGFSSTEAVENSRGRGSHDRERLAGSSPNDGMGDFETLSEDWVVWNEADDRCVLVYRPDVFDTNAFDAACLPTIYLTRGRRSRRPGRQRAPGTANTWYVTLFLEPEVEREAETYDDRPEAVAGAVALAERFTAGEVDYRDLYQVPREAYLEKLDELTDNE